jgi:hypothetical protein
MLEVLIDGVVLHEIALCSTYKVNNDFFVSEGDREARIKPSCKKSERKSVRPTNILL